METRLGTWTLGVSLAFLNCFLSSVGFTMQRKAHLMRESSQGDLEQQGPESKTSNAAAVVSIVGMLLYILAAIPDVFAYALIPQVLCVAVACFRLNLVTFLSCAVLHEVVKFREVIGMVICTCGTFLCIYFGPNNESRASQARAGNIFHHDLVYSYLLVAGAVLVLLLIVVHLPARQQQGKDKSAEKAGKATSHEETDSSQVVQCALPLATGLAFSLEKVFNTELGFLPIERMGESPLSNPLWLTFVSLIAAFGLLDFYLNMRGARKMPVQVFVPLAFAFSTSMQYFQSVVVFREFDDLATKQRVFSMAGACLSLLGSLCIQPPRLSCFTAAVEEDDELQAPHRQLSKETEAASTFSRAEA
eukprot:CAMPEP_0178446834 /NCGR_PEP_ID=MMETSP0689_2-20121128/41041_1 /TAXON_ID=160604 /ORGANISM="Amphidinium massartii, Strain CS-259" /LENGTH=360 /DNA_ID=CAMNT_0020071737 /DNA_START=75 /DNA_END=1153 /DNA_ORIENTATION=-